MSTKAQMIQCNVTPPICTVRKQTFDIRYLTSIFDRPLSLRLQTLRVNFEVQSLGLKDRPLSLRSISTSDMIDNVEKKAQTPFENIRTPRPWEIDTEEHKRKYMKAAHIEVEQKIDRREAEKDLEEARIKAEIEAIRRKNSQKSSPAPQSG